MLMARTIQGVLQADEAEQAGGAQAKHQAAAEMAPVQANLKHDQTWLCAL